MYEFSTVSEIAKELERRHGVAVSPKIISDLIYQRILAADKCPILCGRRMIPLDLMPEIEAKLRERGRLGSTDEGGAA